MLFTQPQFRPGVARTAPDAVVGGEHCPRATWHLTRTYSNGPAHARAAAHTQPLLSFAVWLPQVMVTLLIATSATLKLLVYCIQIDLRCAMRPADRAAATLALWWPVEGSVPMGDPALPMVATLHTKRHSTCTAARCI